MCNSFGLLLADLCVSGSSNVHKCYISIGFCVVNVTVISEHFTNINTCLKHQNVAITILSILIAVSFQERVVFVRSQELRGT